MQMNLDIFIFSYKGNSILLRASFYHERACEREYIPEYLARNENW